MNIIKDIINALEGEKQKEMYNPSITSISGGYEIAIKFIKEKFPQKKKAPKKQRYENKH